MSEKGPENEETDFFHDRSYDGTFSTIDNPFYPNVKQVLDGDNNPDSYEVVFNQAYIFNRVSSGQVQVKEERKISNMNVVHELDREHNIEYYAEVVIDPQNFKITEATFTGFNDGEFDKSTDFPHILFEQFDSEVEPFTGYFPVLRLIDGAVYDYTQRNNIFLSDRQFKQVGESTTGEVGAAHILVESGRKEDHFPVRVRSVSGAGIIEVTEFPDYILLSGDASGSSGQWSGENIGGGAEVYDEYSLLPSQFRTLTGEENIVITQNATEIEIKSEDQICGSLSDADHWAYVNDSKQPAKFRGLKAGTGVYFEKDADGEDYCVTTINIETGESSYGNCGDLSDGAADWWAYVAGTKQPAKFRGLTAGSGVHFNTTADGCVTTIDVETGCCTGEKEIEVETIYSHSNHTTYIQFPPDSPNSQKFVVNDIPVMELDTGSDVIFGKQTENCITVSTYGSTELRDCSDGTKLSDEGKDSDGDGVSSTYDRDGNKSTELGSNSSKEGSMQTYNAAGNQVMQEWGGDGGGNPTYQQRNSANQVVNQTAASASTQTFFNAGPVAIGQNTSTAGTSLDIKGKTKIQDESVATKGVLQFGNDDEQIVTVELNAADGKPHVLLGQAITAFRTSYDDTAAAKAGTPFQYSPDQAASYSAQNAYMIGSSPATGSAILAGSGNSISGHYNVITAGANNTISGKSMSFIGGGSGIDITDSEYSVSVGGQNNDITGSNWSVLGGGYDNLITGGNVNNIGGGYSNEIRGVFASVIAGGYDNLITGHLESAGAVVGGVNNKVEKSHYGFIGAGASNTIQEESDGAVIVGGLGNTLYGTNSFIGGGQENVVSGTYGVALGSHAKVRHDGAFVFTDGMPLSAFSSGDNTLLMSFKSGVYVQSDSGLYVNGEKVVTTSSEADTLQTVTDRGATTTNAIEVANGTIISGSAATTPAADLYVFGSGNSDVINAVRERNDASIKVTSQTAGAYFRTNSATPTYNGLDLNSNWFIGQYGYNDLRIVDGTASAGDSAAAITIQDSTKYVGIGTTNPAKFLHISGSDVNGELIKLEGDASYGATIQYGRSINYLWRAGIGGGSTTNSKIPTSYWGIEDVTSSNTPSIVCRPINQYVGVKNTNPQYELDVSGTIHGTSGNFENGITIDGNPVVTGTSAFESDTLQTVTDQGNITSNDIGAGTITGNTLVITGANSTFKAFEQANDDFRIGTDTADDISIITNGSRRLTVTDAGNVGIGSTSPNYALTVNAGTTNQIARFISSDNDAVIGIQDSNDAVFIGYDAALDVMSLGFDSSMGVSTNVNIDTGGSVGIGTNNPTAQLHVNGPSAGFAEALRLQRAGGNYYSVGLDNSRVNFAYNSQTTANSTLVIDGPSTRVGIGTHAPNQTLDVDGRTRLGGRGYTSGGALIEYASLSETNGGASTILGNAVYAGDSNNTYRKTRSDAGNYIQLNYNKGITFHTNVTGSASSTEYDINNHEQMRITTGGFVGIGTDDPLGTTHIYTADAGGTIVTNASHDDLIIENNGNCGIQLSSPASSYQYLAFGDTASANAGYVRYYHSDDSMVLRAGANDTVTIKGGDVGIGSSVPAYKLDVAGDIQAKDSAFFAGNLGSQGYSFHDLGTGWGFKGLQSSSRLAVLVQGIESVTFESNGRVGIGSTDPALYKLEVAGDIATDRYIRHNGDTNTYFGFSSDDTIQFNTNSSERMRITSAGNVGIGTDSPSNALDVVGHFSATSKSFLIDHPTKENKKLQYASLEGPENGVYVRGTTNSAVIELPDYWSALVHEDSITVVLTPIGKKQDLYIKSKSPETVMIGGVEGSYDYVVYGERKDIDRLEIEPDGN